MCICQMISIIRAECADGPIWWSHHLRVLQFDRRAPLVNGGQDRYRMRRRVSRTCGGEPSGSISVRTGWEAVILMYRARSWGDTDWKSVEQRVPITWTACHLGGQRLWFVCTVYSGGRYCGRRAAVLYCVSGVT
jgi:hypothetical protein